MDITSPSSSSTPAGMVVNVADFGAVPDSGTDSTGAVARALQTLRATGATVLHFPTGRYDFWPEAAAGRTEVQSNTYALDERRIAIDLDGLDSLTLDGAGSAFEFHGRLQPISVVNSRNITLRDFSIDFPVPFLSQATVLAATPERVDLAVDPEATWVVEDGTMVVIGEGWRSPVKAYMEFDPETGQVAPDTGDRGCFQPLGQPFRATDEGNGVLALHHNFTRTPKPGNIVVLRHSRRDLSGILLDNSSDVVVERVAVRHSPGISILAQHSTNLRFSEVSCAPDAASRRVFSGHADGIHVSGCAGLIEVLDCSFAGLMDDSVNVHGTYLDVKEATPERLATAFAHDMSSGLDWALPGEHIALLDLQTLARVGTATVRGVHRKDNGNIDLDITDFDAPGGQAVLSSGLIIENLDRCPDVVVRSSTLGNGRARGLLVSSPGRVLIEGNHFSSSGAAILIAGDTVDWYESGAVRDVIITGNDFSGHCLRAPYQYGEAVISVAPTLLALDPARPYHRGITVTNNTAELSGAAFFYARSATGVTITGNTITRAAGEPATQPRTDLVTLEACSNVSVSDNVLAADLLSTDVVADGVTMEA